MKIKLFLIFLSLFLSFQVLNAQQKDIRFLRLSKEEGLSQSSILAFEQDKEGFIWIGTADGLNKYDGNTVKNFYHDFQNPASIASSRCSAIREDKSGKLWIGTHLGLEKFDKKTETFTHFPKDSDNLPIGTILYIFEDKEGFLWIGTLDKGLKKFDPRTEKFVKSYNFKLNQNSISTNTIYSVLQDPEGFLWIGTGNGGINKLDPKTEKFEHFRHDPKNPNSLISDVAGWIFLDKQDRFWITSYGSGINKMDKKTGKVVRYVHDPKNPYSLLDNKVDKIIQTSTGDIWVATESGLNLLVEHENDSITFFPYKYDPTNTYSISNDHIFVLGEDKAGVVWVGTYKGGMSRFDQFRKKFTNYRHDINNPQSISPDGVRAILEDSQKNLWVQSTQNGIFVASPEDRKKGIFSKYFTHDPSNPLSLAAKRGSCLYQTKDDSVWVGLIGGGLSKYESVVDKKGKTTDRFIRIPIPSGDSIPWSNDKVRAILEDDQQNLWIGTVDGLVFFDRKNYLFKHYKAGKTDQNISHYSTRCLTKDAQGRIWIGTEKGLNIFDIQTQKFTKFFHDPNDSHSLSDDRVNHIYIDSEAVAWISTAGGGLNRLVFDAQGAKFQLFTEKDGLPNNVIYAALPDNEDNFLWLSTNNGLCKFNKKTFEIKKFDVADGLQSNEFNINAYHKSKNTGELFFGGISGLNSFFSEQIEDNNFQAPIYLTDFKIFNKSVRVYGENSVLKEHISLAQEIQLSYEDYVFSFEFASLHFGGLQKKRFRYKLEGFDTDWTETDGKRAFASYTNIPAGNYIFMVMGTNSDGIWSSKKSSVRLTIRPPFWKTIWFISLLIIFVLFSAYAFYKRRINQIKMQKEFLEREVALRTQEISLQKDEIQQQNVNIKASISYAKNIQNAILAPISEIKKILPESFVLFKPRDVVSGDFYWFAALENQKAVLAAVDCTGHGVPGAFMSLIGTNLLNEIIKTKKITSPSLILQAMNLNIKQTLNQSQNKIKDGMEMVLVLIDQSTKNLTFAGAGNPLVYVQNNELLSIRGFHSGVGGSQNEENIDFVDHQISFEQKTTFYLYSDGYQDQFGGAENRKFMVKRFKNLLFEASFLPSSMQEDFLFQTLEKWMGKRKQIDDILVIGFKI